jgi:hypothetical protein
MVDHNAQTDWRLGIGDTRSALGHHTTRLMPRDERELPGLIWSQITSAHAGGANRNHDFTGARLRFGKLTQFDTSVTQKNQASHIGQRNSAAHSR